MTPIGFVEAVAAVAMAGGMFAILWTRRERGIGLRVIQFCAVVFTLPIILILALEKSIPTDVTGTLLGAIAGYLLSGIGGSTKDEEQKDTTGGGPPGAAESELLGKLLGDLEARLLTKVGEGLSLIGPKTADEFESKNVLEAAKRLQQLGLVKLRDPDDMGRIGISLTRLGRRVAAGLSKSGAKHQRAGRAERRRSLGDT